MENKQLTDLEIAIKLEEIEREEYQQELHICKYCGAETTQPDDECYMLRLKQETLEEASEKYAREMWGPYYDEVHPDEPAITLTLGELSVKDFSSGAKWQAKRMYSEEEVKDLILKFNNDKPGIYNASEWFEQYKKK